RITYWTDVDLAGPHAGPDPEGIGRLATAEGVARTRLRAEKLVPVARPILRPAGRRPWTAGCYGRLRRRSPATDASTKTKAKSTSAVAAPIPALAARPASPVLGGAMVTPEELAEPGPEPVLGAVIWAAAVGLVAAAARFSFDCSPAAATMAPTAPP